MISHILVMSNQLNSLQLNSLQYTLKYLTSNNTLKIRNNNNEASEATIIIISNK